MGLYNGNGDLVAQYEYDTWGNVLSVKNASGAAITDPNHVGNLNPFRYRGYYLDTETGLYYLLSRYYDPVTHRFINGDALIDISDIQNNNTFAYCANNPVNNEDPTGQFLNVLVGAAVGGAFSLGWQMLIEHKSFEQVDWIDVGASAIGGGLAASGAGLLVQFVGNA